MPITDSDHARQIRSFKLRRIENCNVGARKKHTPNHTHATQLRLWFARKCDANRVVAACIESNCVVGNAYERSNYLAADSADTIAILAFVASIEIAIAA
jgi:hypothetical protein